MGHGLTSKASATQGVERVRQQWDEQYRRFDASSRVGARPLSNSILAQTYARLFCRLAITQDDVLLDVCCGNGFSSNLLTHRYGCRAIGFDIAIDGVRIASANASALGVSRRALFLVADAQALPFREGAFTRIVVCQALGFFELQPLLRALRARLAPSGELLVTDVAPGWCASDAISCRVTLQELCEQLSNAGFRVTTTGTFGLPLWRLIVRVSYAVLTRVRGPSGRVGRWLVDVMLRLAYSCTVVEQWMLGRFCRGSHFWVRAARDG